MRRSQSRGSSSRSGACAFLLPAIALANAGCEVVRGPSPKLTVRPSSEEQVSEMRLLETPLALAEEDDAIVRVVGPSMTCTGTLIEDDLVLTAHHCLVERGPHGEFTKQLLDTGTVRIELGGGYFAWGEVGVRHIVAPPCGEGGGAGDLAVLVLARKLVGMPTMTPRLEAPPRVGEAAWPVGFGRCALSGDAISRKPRAGGPVRALSAETLHMDASVCPGDSGGPVLANSPKEIVGVVSLSAMDHDETTRGPSIMARIDAYRLVFAHARMIADGSSPSELPPLECQPPPAAPSPRAAQAQRRGHPSTP